MVTWGLLCRDEESDQIGFRGWARMAAPIAEYTIIEVRKPNVGENKPADVTADIVIDTSSKATAGSSIPLLHTHPLHILCSASCSACSTMLDLHIMRIAVNPDVPGSAESLHKNFSPKQHCAVKDTPSSGAY